MFTLLGSGGYVPSPTRLTGCAIARRDDHALVIDAGTGLSRLTSEPQHLDGVTRIDLVLTHFHLDHTVGLSWLAELAPAVTVHGPGEALYGTPTRTIVDRLLDPPFAAGVDGLGDVAIVDAPADGDFAAGPWTVRTRRQERHAAPTLGLRLDDDVTYVTDTMWDPGTVAFARGSRALCHEAWALDGSPLLTASHSSGGEAGRIAAEAGVERLVLIHVNPVTDEADAVLAEAREHFPQAVLGADGLVV